MSEHLKKQIQERMGQKNMTVYALEKAAGLNRSAVRNILQGFSRNPSLETLQSIAATLECSLDDLIGPAETKKDLHFTTKQVPLVQQARRVSATPTHDSPIWSEQLYVEATHVVSELARETGKHLTFDHMTRLIHESYHYALSKHADHIDRDFCRWMICRRAL